MIIPRTKLRYGIAKGLLLRFGSDVPAILGQEGVHRKGERAAQSVETLRPRLAKRDSGEEKSGGRQRRQNQAAGRNDKQEELDANSQPPGRPGIKLLHFRCWIGLYHSAAMSQRCAA